MSTNIEIEAKALVKESDYKKFINHFKKCAEETYTQINYYIDTKDMSMINLGIALRIRKKNNYEMTLKTPLSEGLLEKNQDISEQEFLDFKDKNIFPEGDIKRFITMLGFDVKELKIVTSLTTLRTDINYEDGLLSIDKNEYNKKIDYEIEYEYNSEIGAVAILKELFKKLRITYKENKLSKVVRAINSIK